MGTHIKYRIGKSATFKVMVIVFSSACVLPLLAILGYIIKEGITKINWQFFINVPKPVGE